MESEGWASEAVGADLTSLPESASQGLDPPPPQQESQREGKFSKSKLTSL